MTGFIESCYPPGRANYVIGPFDEEERFMKVTIEIDCTPIEARQFFGLPNVEPVQAKMMARIEQSIAEAIERFSPEALMGTWLLSHARRRLCQVVGQCAGPPLAP